MFESFRKNQKFVLAILAIAAMIAFILGGFLQSLGMVSTTQRSRGFITKVFPYRP